MPFVTSVELCKILNINESRLCVLVNSGKIRKAGRNRYNRDQAVSDYQSNVKLRPAGTGGPGPKPGYLRKHGKHGKKGEKDGARYVEPPSTDDAGVSVGAPSSPTSISLRDAQLRKLAADAVHREMQNRERAGELIELSDVRRAVSQHNASVKSAFLLLPAKLAPVVASLTDTVKCQAVMDAEVRKILTGLSEYALQDRPAAAPSPVPA